MYRQDAQYFSLIPSYEEPYRKLFNASIASGIVMVLLLGMLFLLFIDNLLFHSSTLNVPLISLFSNLFILSVAIFNAKNSFDALSCYIVISSDGIEYHKARYLIFSSWENLNSIGMKKAFIGNYLALKLNPGFKIVPPALARLTGLMPGTSTDIPLHLFSEGPDSPLMQEIYKYRPDLKG